MLAAILSFTEKAKKQSTRIEASLCGRGYEVQRRHFGGAREKTTEEVPGKTADETAEDMPGKTAEDMPERCGDAKESLSAKEFVGSVFPRAGLLVFVGACGIAVRMIAPHVRDKKSDPAVLVVDELGQFVIPILSGHLGGANRCAKWLAEELQATAVITTATDLEGRFAPDLFAEKYHMKIRSMDDAKAVAAAGLERETEILWDVPCDGEMPPEKGAFFRYRHAPVPECGEISPSDPESAGPAPARKQGGENIPCVLVTNAEKAEAAGHPRCVLTPENLAVGIGCRRGAGAEKILSFVREVFRANNLSVEAIRCIASIDKKREEPGLVAAAAALGVPFFTFSAEELNSLPGEFTASEFVKSRMGTDNVCERSAAMAGASFGANAPGRFLVRKQALEGMTLAVYEVPVKGAAAI